MKGTERTPEVKSSKNVKEKKKIGDSGPRGNGCLFCFRFEIFHNTKYNRGEHQVQVTGCLLVGRSSTTSSSCAVAENTCSKILRYLKMKIIYS
jgi:hypothetical protein